MLPRHACILYNWTSVHKYNDHACVLCNWTSVHKYNYLGYCFCGSYHVREKCPMMNNPCTSDVYVHMMEKHVRLRRLAHTCAEYC